MEIRALGEAFEVTLPPAEFEVLMYLIETLGDHDEDCTFHWPAALSPTRESIVERFSPAVESFVQTWEPGTIGKQEHATDTRLADAGELDVLGRMFSHGTTELDDDFEIITGWPPAIATSAADDVAGVGERRRE